MKTKDILCIIVVIIILLIFCNVCCSIYLIMNKIRNRINRIENFGFATHEGPQFGIGYNYHDKCDKKKIDKLIDLYSRLKEKYKNDKVKFKDPIIIEPKPNECRYDCKCVWAGGQHGDNSSFQLYKNWKELEDYYKSFEFKQKN